MSLKDKIKTIAENIDDYVLTVRSLHIISNDLNIEKSASPAINFRDALCHYILLYESYEKEEEEKFFSQATCIEEHLHRGIKDTMIVLLYAITDRLYSLIRRDSYLNLKKQKPLRENYHYFKNLILRLRLDSIEIKRYIGIKEIIISIENKLTGLIKLLNKNDLYKLFLQKFISPY